MEFGTKKIVLVLVDETKYPNMIVLNHQKVKKKGFKTPNIEWVPCPG